MLGGDLIVRSHTWGDLDSVVELWQEADLHDLGMIESERDEFVDDWSMPSLALDLDTAGVWDGSDLLAEGMVLHESIARVTVRPSARGRGIGSFLRAWTEQRLRERGSDRVEQIIPNVNAPAAALLAAAGYAPQHTSWFLRIEHDHPPQTPAPPPGIQIRAFQRGADEHSLYRLVEDAFNELSGYQSQSYGDFAVTTFDRAGGHDEDFLVAVEAEQLVGTACCYPLPAELWVGWLAVRKSHRSRGIGRALLQAAFCAAWDQGFRRTGLSTDSRTGALRLYERAGMRIEREYTRYGLDL